MIKKVKGTQDLLSMKPYDALCTAASDHFSTAHFSHIQTPIIEPLALFKRSVGEETDIVGKEMYTFATNDKEVLCLRPEATASTIRAFFEAGITQRPWQVFSYGPMFRHERPQKGRWRQFSQFNVEAIGISSIAQDARFIAQLNDFFSRRLGMCDYVLSINYLGTAEDRLAHKTALKDFLAARLETLCSTCLVRANANVLRIFDCKNEGCQTIYQSAPLLTHYLSPESEKKWQELNAMLDVLSISRIHNPLLVRGLDYYNNVVFEFSSPLLGAQSTFCGGGQYDLSKAFEQKQALPAIGAAFGIERLLLLLETAGLLPQAPEAPVIGVLALEEALMPLALLADQTLQRAGLTSTLLVGGLNKGLKKANAEALRLVVLIGENEKNEGTLQIKDMLTGVQHTASQESFIAYLQDLLPAGK